MDNAADDRALVRAIAGGDAKALERLFTRNQTRVFRYLVRVVHDEAAAAALMNDVFLAAWQDAARCDRRSEPSTWLLSIAHAKAASVRPKQNDDSNSPDTAETRPGHNAASLAGNNAASLEGDETDDGAPIRAAMAGLSGEHCEILDLVYFQEQSIAQVATVLAVSQAAVKARMLKARKELSELLKAGGIDRGWPR